MPSNTLFNPQNEIFFEKSKMQKDAKGIQQTVTASGNTNIDLTLTDDELVVGGTLLVNLPYQGDKVAFQALYGGVVVAQFITDWYLNPLVGLQVTPKSKFPAKVPATAVLRVIYTATGPDVLGTLVTPVWVAINFDMHKVLV